MPPARAARSERRIAVESGIYELPEVPTEALWRRLDRNRCEALTERAVRMSMRGEARRSPLDTLSLELTTARRTLATLADRAASSAVADHLSRDRRAVRALAAAYRFVAELANELVAIAALGLDEAAERAEAEACRPRALRAFDQLVVLFEAVDAAGNVDADEQTRAFMWDMGAVRAAMARVLSTLFAVS